jgi:hypothetical protein
MAVNVMGLAVGGSSLIGVFSLFTGFYWWCARTKSVSSFTLSFQKCLSSDAAIFDVRVANRSRKKLVIKGVSALFPISILADDRGEPCTAEIIPGDQEELDHLQYTKTHYEIEPRSAAAWTIIVCHSSGFQARTLVTVKLHFRTNCPLVEQTIVLTAVASREVILDN